MDASGQAGHDVESRSDMHWAETAGAIESIDSNNVEVDNPSRAFTAPPRLLLFSPSRPLLETF